MVYFLKIFGGRRRNIHWYFSEQEHLSSIINAPDMVDGNFRPITIKQ